MMAVVALRNGIKTGVLPSGIAKSAEKLNSHGEFNRLTILSLGDPFIPFNRSEYLPSVLAVFCYRVKYCSLQVNYNGSRSIRKLFCKIMLIHFSLFLRQVTMT